MGSVTIVDLSSGVDKAVSKNITFESYDSKREQLTENQVILKKNTAPSVDLEPEYIAVSTDSRNAYVALQENNAIAKLNLETGKFEYVKGLGFKDHSQDKNAIDLIKDGSVNITTQPVYGMYMPDGIEYFEQGGKRYLVTANEGDSREWGDYLNEVEIKIEGEEVVTIDTTDYDGLDENKTYIFGGRSFSIYDADTLEQVLIAEAILNE